MYQSRYHLSLFGCMKEFPFWIFTCGFIKIVKINQFGVDVMNGSLFDFILTLGVKQRFLQWNDANEMILKNGAFNQSALNVWYPIRKRASIWLRKWVKIAHTSNCTISWNCRISNDLKILLSVWTMTSYGFADIKFKIFWRYFKDVSEEWFRFI